jgi:hypothetical protein
MTPDLAVSLLAAWLASWSAEERALAAAAVAELMPPAAIGTHRATIKRERDQLGPLLNRLARTHAVRG